MIVLSSVYLFYKSSEDINTEVLTIQIIDKTNKALIVRNNNGVTFELKANKNHLESVVLETKYKITYYNNKLLVDKKLKIKSIKIVNE